LTAQVTTDANFVAQGGGNVNTLSNFTVPAGNNRVLVVGIHSGSTTPTSVTHNGVSMTPAVQSGDSYEADIWYLALGSGAAMVGPFDIVANGAPFAMSAVSFQNVNQTTVFANPLTANGDNLTSTNLSVPTSDANNLVIDIIGLGSFTTPSATHTELGTGNVYGLGSAQGTGGNVSVGWSFSISSFAHSAIELICDTCPVPNSGAVSIPTLSEWGLLILALVLMTAGTLYLVQLSVRNSLEQE